jgi:hypothetical protein
MTGADMDHADAGQVFTHPALWPQHAQAADWFAPEMTCAGSDRSSGPRPAPRSAAVVLARGR